MFLLYIILSFYLYQYSFFLESAFNSSDYHIIAVLFRYRNLIVLFIK